MSAIATDWIYPSLVINAGSGSIEWSASSGNMTDALGPATSFLQVDTTGSFTPKLLLAYFDVGSVLMPQLQESDYFGMEIELDKERSEAIGFLLGSHVLRTNTQEIARFSPGELVQWGDTPTETYGGPTNKLGSTLALLHQEGFRINTLLVPTGDFLAKFLQARMRFYITAPSQGSSGSYRRRRFLLPEDPVAAALKLRRQQMRLAR